MTRLRLTYIAGFVAATAIGGAVPGVMIGSLFAMISGIFDPTWLVMFVPGLLPLGIIVVLPATTIWLIGAMATASAIERLHR